MDEVNGTDGTNVGKTKSRSTVSPPESDIRPEVLEPGRWWNGSLRSLDQLATAAERAEKARMPLSGDPAVDWEAVETLELILAETEPSARVADIGLRDHEPLLTWLSLLGYRRVQTDPAVRARANRGLLHAGGGPAEVGERPWDGPGDGEHDVVVCRSAPGDHVSLTNRLRQARTLLRPGGLFVLGTQFWGMPVPFQGSRRRCAKDYLCCDLSADALTRAGVDMGMISVAPVYLGGTPESGELRLPGLAWTPAKVAFRKRAGSR